MLRFSRGEEVIGGLADFCGLNNISSGYFSGIGAAKETVLSFYDLERKEYQDKKVEKDLEIASLLGNAAKMQGKMIIHCHGSFSDADMAVVAGHVKKLVVSGTTEITFQSLGARIEREYDGETGLNLLK
ncbi:MAG: hypothetical protein COT34_00230 [Candidatus Nealsonbacteria bacterium CG08_land_8_20_14_0_20_43_11]|uniref:PPC domain-containing protein n=1 Tax=Candidatus Nealsonbacteria bacterium CG08_land_8_20_14_0_20_43_11 TaxID=1974706 RepID=A0A2M6T1G2_9BACT|nr:MAG: hypothetical protein COT34_00230 [Candidatus Nealsonbacteria bacterium CG08_land_8_20_14_0_20_43_11]